MRLTYFIPLALIPFAFGSPLARDFSLESNDAVGKTDTSKQTEPTSVVTILKRPQVQNEPQQRPVSPEDNPQEDDENWSKHHTRSHRRSSTSCDDPTITSTRAPVSTKTTSSAKTTYSTKASTETRATDPAKTTSKTKTNAASETKSYHLVPEASADTVTMGIERRKASVDHTLNPDHTQFTVPNCHSDDKAKEIACLRDLTRCMHQYCDRIGTIVPPVPDPSGTGYDFCKYRMLAYPLNITDEHILYDAEVLPYDWLYAWRFCPGWNLTQDPGARSGNKKRSLPISVPSISLSQTTFTDAVRDAAGASPAFAIATPTLRPNRAVHDDPAGDVDPEEIMKDLTDLLRKCQNLDSKTDDPWLISLCNALAGTLPAGTGPILPVQDITPGPDLQKLLGFCDSLKDTPDAPYTAILEYICPFIEKLKNLPPSGSGTTQVISASSTASPADVEAAISSALGLAGSIFPFGGVQKRAHREGGSTKRPGPTDTQNTPSPSTSAPKNVPTGDNDPRYIKRQELDLSGGHLDVKPGSVINDPLPNPNAVSDRAADDQDDKNFLNYGANLDQDSQADANFFANGGNNNDQDDATDNDFFENGRHNGTPDDDDGNGSRFSSGGDNYGPIHGNGNNPGHGGGRPPTNGDPGAHCEDPDEVDPWRKNTCRPASQKPTGTGSHTLGSSYATTTANTAEPTSKSDDPTSPHSTKPSGTGTPTQHTPVTSTGASEGVFSTSDCIILSAVSSTNTASGHLSSTSSDPRDSTKNPDTATSKKTSPTSTASYSATATSAGDGIAVTPTSGSHGGSSPTTSAGYGSPSFGDGRTHRTSTTKATDPVSTTKSGDGIAITPGSDSPTGTGHGGGSGTKTTDTADSSNGVEPGTSTSTSEETRTRGSHTRATGHPSSIPGYYGS